MYCYLSVRNSYKTIFTIYNVSNKYLYRILLFILDLPKYQSSLTWTDKRDLLASLEFLKFFYLFYRCQ